MKERLLRRNGVEDRERAARLQAELDATDWYVSRFAETGELIPEAVRAARRMAREELSRLRGGAR
jgi:hypothetical protein